MNFGWSDLGFLLFSPHVPFQSFFSITCVCKFWMVRSWTPTFLMRNFPVKVFFQKTRTMNFGRVDLEEGAGRTINTLLVPSILLNFCHFNSLHGSRGYSIYSCAQLSWHSTSENDGWSILGSYFSHFHWPVQLSTQKTFNSELWVVRSWIQLFPSHFPSLKVSFSDSCKNEL